MDNQNDNQQAQTDSLSQTQAKFQGSISGFTNDLTIDYWHIIETLLDNRKVKSIFYFINNTRFDYDGDPANFREYVESKIEKDFTFALIFEFSNSKYFRINRFSEFCTFTCQFFKDQDMEYYLKILNVINKYNFDNLSLNPYKGNGYKFFKSLYHAFTKKGIKMRNFGFDVGLFDSYSLDKIIKDGRYDPNKAKELETILLNAPMYSVEKISNNRLVFRMVENLQDLKQDLEYERAWMDCHQYFENELPKVMIDSNDIRYY